MNKIESGTIEAIESIGLNLICQPSFGCWICGQVQPVHSGHFRGAFVHEAGWGADIAAMVCLECAAAIRQHLYGT
jgi:hypothetical protein